MERPHLRAEPLALASRRRSGLRGPPPPRPRAVGGLHPSCNGVDSLARHGPACCPCPNCHRRAPHHASAHHLDGPQRASLLASASTAGTAPGASTSNPHPTFTGPGTALPCPLTTFHPAPSIPPHSAPRPPPFSSSTTNSALPRPPSTASSPRSPPLVSPRTPSATTLNSPSPELPT